MLEIDYNLNPQNFAEKLDRFWQLSGEKILLIEKEFDPQKGAPVFTQG